MDATCALDKESQNAPFPPPKGALSEFGEHKCYFT